MADNKIDIKRMQYGLQNEAGCLPTVIAARTVSYIEERVWNQFDIITGWSLITHQRLT